MRACRPDSLRRIGAAFIYWSSWADPYKNLRQAGFGGIETKATLRWMGPL